MNNKEIKQVRESFPHGAVVLSGNTMSIAYPRPIDVESTEVFIGKRKRVFENLIEDAVTVRFVMNPEHGLRIVFESSTPFNNGALVYNQPLAITMTYDELWAYAHEGVPKLDIRLNLSEEELFELQSERSLPSLTSYRQWPELYEAAHGFKPYTGFCTIDYVMPEYDGDAGAIEYDYHTDDNRVLEFTNDAKGALLTLIQASESLELDYIASETEARFTLTFGVEGS